jgi:hypothetical protein
MTLFWRLAFYSGKLLHITALCLVSPLLFSMGISWDIISSLAFYLTLREAPFYLIPCFILSFFQDTVLLLPLGFTLYKSILLLFCAWFSLRLIPLTAFPRHWGVFFLAHILSIFALWGMYQPPLDMMLKMLITTVILYPYLVGFLLPERLKVASYE